jgi:hypothetical protein
MFHVKHSCGRPPEPPIHCVRLVLTLSNMLHFLVVVSQRRLASMKIRTYSVIEGSIIGDYPQRPCGFAQLFRFNVTLN